MFCMPKLKHWKNLNNEIKNRNKILNKLKRHKLNEIRKKEEEEKKKLAISHGVNDFQVISDEPPKPNKDSKIFISSSQNDINIEAQPTPAPQFSISQASQNFSLIPPELNKFEFLEPIPKNNKLEKNPIVVQLDDIKSFLNNKMNNNKKNLIQFEFLEPNPKNSKLEKKRIPNQLDDINSFLENKKLKIKENIPKGVEKLNDLLNKKLKKDFFDKLEGNLKKKEDIGDGFNILDKLINNKLKKDGFDRLKNIANARNAIEDLDKLLLHKYRQKFLDNLKSCEKLSKIFDNMFNILRKNNRK